MTPKEKAEELVNKYWDNIPDIFFEDAKQCALIAVDELIEFTQYCSEFGGEILGDTKEYWEIVKIEIERL